MPRRKLSKRKRVEYDPLYNSSVVAKLINGIMKDGKKSLAQRVVYGAMDMLNEKSKEDPLKVVLKAIDNVRPHVETRSRRVGGATYQVPMEVRKERSFSLGIRWIIQNARERAGKSIKEKLMGEILDAYNSKGGAIKKKEVVLKMAESNRAFAHYRW